MTEDEALDLALEALQYIHEGANNQGPHTGISWRCVAVKAESAIKAIKQARSAPVQEPVGKVIASVPHLRSISVELLPEAPVPSEDSLLYTTPPAAQRQWVRLKDEERVMCRSYDIDEAIANTEAKLKEKNT